MLAGMANLVTEYKGNLITNVYRMRLVAMDTPRAHVKIPQIQENSFAFQMRKLSDGT